MRKRIVNVEIMKGIDWLLPPTGSGMMIALVGGGGKTSLMFALAAAAGARGLSVITATTTHIRPPLPKQSTTVLLAENYAGKKFLDIVRKNLRSHSHLTLGNGYSPETGKISGLAPELLDALALEKTADLILVEADGARNFPLKAPAEHEPALPRGADLCLALLGLDGFFAPLRQSVFRAELALGISPQDPGAPPSPALAAHLALHGRGLLRLCPPGMKTAVICNKADLPGALEAARAVRDAAIKLYPAHKARWHAASARENWMEDLP